MSTRPVFDGAEMSTPRSSSPPEVRRETSEDPAWEALMKAPPLRSPLTDDEKRAIDDWKARRAARKNQRA